MDETQENDPTYKQEDESVPQWLLRMRENENIDQEALINAVLSQPSVDIEDLVDAATNTAVQTRRDLAKTWELDTPDHSYSRQVKITLGECIRIEDGPRKVYISLDSDKNLRVEMIDEEKNLIETEENNQPTYDNVNATLKTSN